MRSPEIENKSSSCYFCCVCSINPTPLPTAQVILYCCWWWRGMNERATRIQFLSVCHFWCAVNSHFIIGQPAKLSMEYEFFCFPQWWNKINTQTSQKVLPNTTSFVHEYKIFHASFYFISSLYRYFGFNSPPARAGTNQQRFYRGADKSLAWPDWKNNWKFAIFRPTQRSLLPRRPGWTDKLLNFFEWLAKVRVWSLQLRLQRSDSNFCKPLKKIQKFARPTRSRRQQWSPLRTKNGDLSIVF